MPEGSQGRWVGCYHCYMRTSCLSWDVWVQLLTWKCLTALPDAAARTTSSPGPPSTGALVFCMWSAACARMLSGVAFGILGTILCTVTHETGSLAFPTRHQHKGLQTLASLMGKITPSGQLLVYAQSFWREGSMALAFFHVLSTDSPQITIVENTLWFFNFTVVEKLYIKVVFWILFLPELVLCLMGPSCDAWQRQRATASSQLQHDEGKQPILRSILCC